jgi:RNA polymerase sigma factor (sigma-70 family)
VITKAREYELIKAAQAGDLSARDELIASHNGFIWKRAMAWKNNLRGHDEDDIRQQIWVGLCDAVERFDTSTGCRFLTYAGFSILKAINACQENDRVIKYPRSQYRRDYTSKYGNTVCHLCVDVPNERPETPVHTLSQMRDYVAEAESKELTKQLKRRLQRLTKRQRYVLLEHANGKTFREISIELGVSHERVRQIELQAFEKLKALFSRKRKPKARRLNHAGDFIGR